MAGRRLDTMDLRELLRHIQQTHSDRAVQRATGIDRRTVQHYRKWATDHSLLEDNLPPIETLQQLVGRTLSQPAPPQNVSTVEPYRDIVSELRQNGTEVTAIWHRLKERGYAGGLSSVYRFVAQLEKDKIQNGATVRVERAPSEEAQVDFGYAGLMIDPATGEMRKTWAFVMTLAFSRHQYVEFVFEQNLANWILLHRHAFEFLGGVPKRVVTDNLKAAVTKTDWLGDDPILQLAYRECAEHYGFLIAPCRPRTPEHKGKVESGVHFLKRNFLGGRIPTTITVANKEVREWCLTTAGKRIHGTTKRAPLELFEQVEKPLLKALPQTSYDLAIWKDLILHRDCYIVFEGSFYSAPFRFIGQKLRVRGGSREVRIYTQQYELVATHTRATRSGQRFTHPDHLPPHKLPGLQLERVSVQAEANNIGTATGELVKRLLEDSVLDRLPSAGRVVRLKHHPGIGEERLEAACKRALSFDEASYKTVKRILEQGLDQPSADAVAATSKDPPSPTMSGQFNAETVQPPRRFKRTASELLGHLFSLGGGMWN